MSGKAASAAFLLQRQIQAVVRERTTAFFLYNRIIYKVLDGAILHGKIPLLYAFPRVPVGSV